MGDLSGRDWRGATPGSNYSDNTGSISASHWRSGGWGWWVQTDAHQKEGHQPSLSMHIYTPGPREAVKSLLEGMWVILTWNVESQAKGAAAKRYNVQHAHQEEHFSHQPSLFWEP